MSITLTNSKETVSRLIREDFEKIDWSMEYIYNRAETLIQTAKDFGLTELAEQMKNDK